MGITFEQVLNLNTLRLEGKVSAGQIYPAKAALVLGIVPFRERHQRHHFVPRDLRTSEVRKIIPSLLSSNSCSTHALDRLLDEAMKETWLSRVLAHS